MNEKMNDAQESSEPATPDKLTDETVSVPESFARALDRVITEIKAIRLTSDSSMEVITRDIEAKAKELTLFTKPGLKELRSTDGKETYEIDLSKIQKFLEFVKRFHVAALTPAILSNAMFVSLVSRWDAYFIRILRTIYHERAEVISSSQRSLTISDLKNFDSIAEARAYIIDAEIDNVLRESHERHFDYLRDRLSINISRTDDIWKRFIELTDRRNLIVHTDSVISKQYIEVCKRAGVELTVELGGKVSVTQDYFDRSCDTLMEFAIKVGHLIWRKLSADHIKEQEDHYNAVTYELIRDARYNVAISLLEPLIKDAKNFKSEAARKTAYVNLAQSYRWSGDRTSCVSLLTQEDWSSSRDKFLLACHVLKDEIEQAAALITKMGCDGEVTREDYENWPLFNEFRQTPEFSAAYTSVFGGNAVALDIKTTELISNELVGGNVPLTLPLGN